MFSVTVGCEPPSEIEAGLGRPLHELFQTVDPEPIASASIGSRASASPNVSAAWRIRHFQRLPGTKLLSDKFRELSDNILKRTYEEKFVIHKKIEISKRLVTHYPTDSLHQATKKIKIKNIKRFRLLSNPSEKWLSQIDRELRSVEMKYGHDEAVAWSPRWYHDIMKNQEFREEMNDRLKQCR